MCCTNCLQTDKLPKIRLVWFTMAMNMTHSILDRSVTLLLLDTMLDNKCSHKWLVNLPQQPKVERTTFATAITFSSPRHTILNFPIDVQINYPLTWLNEFAYLNKMATVAHATCEDRWNFTSARIDKMYMKFRIAQQVTGVNCHWSHFEQKRFALELCLTVQQQLISNY